MQYLDLLYCTNASLADFDPSVLEPSIGLYKHHIMPAGIENVRMTSGRGIISNNSLVGSAYLDRI